MDEGAPIAYTVLDAGVPVLSAEGIKVGTVHHVVSAPEEDIFHGLVLATEHGRRFVAAEEVASLHEHGVDLSIDAAAVAQLPEPGGGALMFSEDPAAGKWSHWVNRLTLRKDWHRED